MQKFPTSFQVIASMAESLIAIRRKMAP